MLQQAPKTYFKLTIQQVTGSNEELLETLCFEHGATGIAEQIPLKPETLDNPLVQDRDSKSLDVFFHGEPSRQFFEKIFQVVEPENVQGSVETNKDWLEEWKKDYHAFSLVDTHWVVPSWEKAPTGTTPIFIDPGMAFGTGTHQTTKGCAQLIYQYLKTNSPKTMIDVGTGTGILSILSSQMGVSKILATEIDEESVVVAKENLERNQIQNVQVLKTETTEIMETFDLVVANIIDGVLLDIKQDLIRLLKPGGSMILSGILVERDPLFISAFLENTSLQIVHRQQTDEWVCYLLRSL